MMIRSAKLRAILVIMLAYGSGASWAALPDDTPPPEQAQAETTDESSASPPSLDDLLGIESAEEDDDSAREAAERDREEELRRELNERRISEAFVLAVEKMKMSAARLDESFDPGLGTQRIQEEILARLDELIDQANQMQQGGGGGSSSSSQQSQSTPPPQQQSDQNSQNASGDGQRGSGDSREGDPPPRQEGDINTLIDETRSEWGSLPERVREEMEQGRGGSYSNLYRALTEAYYKRLAEEGSQ